VFIKDTITPCNNSSGVGIYDTIPLTSPACQSLFWIRPDTIDGNYLATNLSSGTGLSYLWNFGDGTTSTLPYPSHQYATADKYEVCLTVDNGMGCTDTHCDSAFYNYKTGGGPMQTLNVVNIGTGISNIVQPVTVTLYPNPASGHLSVTATSNITGINIYNITGCLVTSTKATGNTVVLSLTTLTPGVYLTEIKTGNQSVMKRFIKQ
jgi:PKD repeat protein